MAQRIDDEIVAAYQLAKEAGPEGKWLTFRELLGWTGSQMHRKIEALGFGNPDDGYILPFEEAINRQIAADQGL